MVQRVGVIGCGVISDIYLRNAPLFKDFSIIACADMRPEAAQAKAKEYGIRAMSLDDIYASDEIDIVLNLTNPEAHATVLLRALEAGKHVYTEKPLATSLSDGQRILDFARAGHRYVGCAPDTVLGAGVQTARECLMDDTVGEVMSGVATIMSRGMEDWHPNPAFYFQQGGGPVLDMGPYYIATLVTLLGPVSRVNASGRIGLSERVVTAEGPHQHSRIAVEVPTTIHANLTFASGAQIAFLLSWDVCRHGHTPIELHGENASLRVPDPNFFGGELAIASRGEDWKSVDMQDKAFGLPNDPSDAPVHANYRGLGLADMAAAIEAGRPPRTNVEMAHHTLDVMLGILRAVEEDHSVVIQSSCEKPDALSDEDARALMA